MTCGEAGTNPESSSAKLPPSRLKPVPRRHITCGQIWNRPLVMHNDVDWRRLT
jgi:hypothetical protein